VKLTVVKHLKGGRKPFMDKNRLAAVGFYYTSRGDIVRCAFCGVEVACWQEGDSSFDDHKRWGPSCGFVKGFVIGNIPIDNPETSREPARSKEAWEYGFKGFVAGKNPIDKPEAPHSKDVCGSFMELRPNSRPEQGKNNCVISCV
jgi:hypothetical protein